MDKDYKRLTTYNEKYNCYAIDNNKLQNGDDVCYMDTNESIFVGGAIDKLAELETKIENGTLIELPFIQQPHQGIWEVFFFNTRINGVMCYLFTNEDGAEAKLRELQGERE